MKARRSAARAFGIPAITLLARSWRFLELDGAGKSRRAATRLAPAVYALWHAHLLPLALLHRGEGAVVLVSRHRDGELLATLLRQLGYLPVRGSSSRGGAAGLKEMIARGREGRPLGFTPDGPRGPAGRVKPGVVAAASATGRPIVPVAVAADRGWRFGSWDGFLVPAPFATVVISYGEPLLVPARVRTAEMPAWLEEVGERIDRERERCRGAVRAASTEVV